jgi:hypothetical protein
MATPPRVRAYLLVDGYSIAMLNQFKVLIHELDRASGYHLDVVMFGDPALTGPHAVAYRSAQEVAEIPVLAAEYVRDYVQTGRDSHHVVQESREQARFLGIAESLLPCVVLLDKRTAKVITTLRIEREWGETDLAQRAAGRGFESMLASRPLLDALKQYDGEPAAVAELARQFAVLGHAISLEVARATGNEGLARRLPPPNGTILYSRDEAGARLFTFRSHPVHLSKVPGSFLRALMRCPSTFVDLYEIAEVASSRKDDAGFNAVKWGKDTKRAVMKALRESAGWRTSAEALDEINRLITVKTGSYRLNLRPDQVWLS